MPVQQNSKKSGSAFLGKKPFIFALLALTVYVSHFLYSFEFGFYEDDFTLFPHLMDGNFLHVLRSLPAVLTAPLAAIWRDTALGGHGRPFSPFFFQLFGTMGSNLAGLWGMYLVAWAIEAFNAIIVFLILSRRHSKAFALAGALIYAVLPSNTVRQLLTSAFEIETSGTFLALATLTYCLGIRVLPYLLITVSLWDYEFFFFPFLAAPLLLDIRWDRGLVKKFVAHGLILGFIVAFTLLMRAKAGEGRVTEMFGYIHEIPLRVIQAIYTGTYATLFYSFYGAALSVAENIASLDPIIIATLLISSIFLSFVFIKNLPGDTNSTTGAIPGDAGNLKLAKAIVAGLCFVALSYPMAFYGDFFSVLATRPYAVYDRASRVHVASALGAAMVIPSIYMLAVNNLRRAALRRGVSIALAVVISISIAYGLRVQDGYRKTWEYQQWLWTAIIEQTPDMGDNTLIFVETAGLPIAPYAEAHSWFGTPFSLAYIYGFPDEWKAKPRMNYKSPDWASTDVRLANGRQEIFIRRPDPKRPSNPRWEELPDGNIVLFAPLGDKLVRIDGVVSVNDFQIMLKEKPASMAGPEWPRGILYDHLVKPGRKFDIPERPAPYRRLLKAPPVGAIRSFDGRTYSSEPSFDRSDIGKYTIELWIRPDFDSALRLMPVKGRYTDKYPPMPAIIGPMRLDHTTRETLLVSLKGSGDTDAGYAVEGILSGSGETGWMHIEAAIDNDARVARLFINGTLVQAFEGIEFPLRGQFTLGKGFNERYWKGDIADLRISSALRHTNDFEPADSALSFDEATLYIMPAKGR
jgi:hypothetical protein